MQSAPSTPSRGNLIQVLVLMNSPKKTARLQRASYLAALRSRSFKETTTYNFMYEDG